MNPSGQISIEPRENSEIEFKAGFNYDPKTGVNKLLRYNVAKTICGFLNASGGCLYIGVQDDGQVCGIDEEMLAKFKRPDLDAFEQGFHEFIKRKISPYPFLNIRFSFATAQGQTIAVVEVERAQYYVYLVNCENGIESNDIYVRTGNRTILLTDKARDQFVIERLGANWMH